MYVADNDKHRPWKKKCPKPWILSARGALEYQHHLTSRWSFWSRCILWIHKAARIRIVCLVYYCKYNWDIIHLNDSSICKSYIFFFFFQPNLPCLEMLGGNSSKSLKMTLKSPILGPKHGIISGRFQKEAKKLFYRNRFFWRGFSNVTRFSNETELFGQEFGLHKNCCLIFCLNHSIRWKVAERSCSHYQNNVKKFSMIRKKNPNAGVTENWQNLPEQVQSVECSRLATRRDGP